MIKNFQIKVTGKVQGVWFRKYTREAAMSFSLVGCVQNEKEGHVSIEAEGKENDLMSLVNWLHQGSPLSEVHEV